MVARRWPRLAALLFAAMFVGAACSKSSSTESAASPSPSEGAGASASPSASSSGSGGQLTVGSDKANNHGSKDVSGESSVEVEMDNFYFGPTVLSGKPGQKIQVELKNEGSATHNFSIDQQKISKDVATGQSATVTVTFPSSGFVEFYCKFHKTLGMVGELTTS